MSCKSDKTKIEITQEGSTILETKTITIDQQINNQSISRSVIIQTPLIVDGSKKYPIVMAFHGGGGDNSHWTRTLRQFTDSGAFIGVYPQGHMNSWNLGPERSNADDIAFVNEIMEHLNSYTNVDFDRIFAIGTSNGSAMVNLLGAKTSHFKAIAPVASQLISSIDITKQTQPLSVFQINGAQDDAVPINGGNRFGHLFFDAYESAQKWAFQFGCNDNPATKTINGNITYVFSQCSDGIVIKYLRIENAGHNITQNYPILWQTIWSFFETL
jgi:poly(3-hydroxybutyrate) depolymerase